MSKMPFYRLASEKKVRDALCFLQFEEIPSATKPLPGIEEMRMTRVPFGRLYSLFLLSATLQYHFSHVDSHYRVTSARLQEAST